jgi:ABC-type glycerol-3-phosphate transport system substrate-binding protein
MVSRRAFTRGAGAALAAASAAACTPSVVRRTAQPELAVATPRPSGPPVALEFWLPGSQADAEALKPFHEQFLAETSGVSGVTVRLVTNETMMPEVAAALAAGTPPDVARLKEYRLADLGARDALLALDRQVAQDPAVRLADFTPQSVEGSRAPVRASGGAGSVPAGGSGGAGSQRGKTTGASASQSALLGVPDSHQLVVLYWNRDLVAAAGGDPARAPANWDALRQAARASMASVPTATGSGEAEKDAKRWGFQFYEFSLREQVYCWFMEWVWRAGGEVWANQGRDRTRATLDTPEAQRALQFHVDLLYGDRTAVLPGTPVPELIANVTQGRVGYWMTTANAALTYARTAPGLRFGVGPMPPDRRGAHQLQHNALSVFKDSRAPDFAYRLVSFRSREEVQARWAAEGAWLPVRPALWRRPPFSQDALWQAIGQIVQAPGNRTKPVVPEWDAFTGVVLPRLLAAWRGELAPREALAAAERAANTALAAPSGATPPAGR